MATAKSRVVLLLLVFTVSPAFPGFTTTKIGPQPIWNATFTDKLRQDLLLNYDKFARPAQHYNVTTVKFGLSIKHVEVNEFKSTITVHTWLRFSWIDEKLKWNSSDYGGINMLNLADHEIWQPDIVLENSATSSSISHYGNVHCRVRSNGEVTWIPPAQLTALCDLNMKYWPFDRQECELIFGSWDYSGDQIDLQLIHNDTKDNLDLMVPNSEWELSDLKMFRRQISYANRVEIFTDVWVGIFLSRNSPSYRAVIITPSFVIIILTLLNFWLPPQAGEKILLNACTAIIICLFMLYFSQRIPAMGNHTPLIVLFYSSCLYVVGFSMIGSVIVIWISRTKHTKSLPWAIKQPLIGPFGKLMGLNTYIQQSSTSSHRVTAEEMRDHQVTDSDDQSGDEHHIVRSSKMPMQQDWILLAAAIDRLSFCFYCLLFAVLSIVYSV